MTTLESLGEEAREWLLDLMWVEEDAHEQIENLDLEGLIAAINLHYDGSWRAFVEAGTAGGAA